MTASCKINNCIRFSALLLLCFVTACSSRPSGKQTSTGAGGYYKVGQPYQIKGQWYYPKEDYSYDESGIASWYGDDFHAQMTANGETYNKYELTAAHKTLPLPSLARVTNLENGRSVVVRVNDRGPFSGARIIDVSQRSAQLLGFEKQGTAKVRVQVLADESKAIADAMRRYGGPSDTAEQIVASAQTQKPGAVQPAYSSPSSAQVQTFNLEPPVSQAPMPTTIASTKPVAEYVQLPVSGSHNIYLQAGAFTKLENATRMKRTLTKVGQATIAEALVKGVQYYRVRIGPIDSVADADKLLKRVVSSGVEGARIVVD